MNLLADMLADQAGCWEGEGKKNFANPPSTRTFPDLIRGLCNRAIPALRFATAGTVWRRVLAFWCCRTIFDLMTEDPEPESNRNDVRFERQFEKLERLSPRAARWLIRWLRSRYAFLVRVPLGLALVFGGVFSFLPVLGFWMLPFGLFLLAVDLPFLRRPVGRFIVWAEQQWARWKRWRGKGRMK